MMDIVERLRDGCSCNIDETPCMAESECREAYEAADEITRLRAALQGLVSAVDGMSCGNWIWQTEVPNALAKARAALQEKQDG